MKLNNIKEIIQNVTEDLDLGYVVDIVKKILISNQMKINDNRYSQKK